jgi:hypothetical protein
LTAVLFTLGLIYAGMLGLCISRTYKKVIKPTNDDDEFRQVFRYFYCFIWSVLATSCALYFWLCTRDLTATNWI